MKRIKTLLCSLSILGFILVACSPLNQAIASPKLSSGIKAIMDKPVYAQGEISSSGQLNGNLILVASGDLTMGGRATPEGEIAYTNVDHNDANALGICQLTPQNPLAGIEDLARQAAKKGIGEIKGEVIVDTRFFPENPAPSLELEYPLSPIIINDNLIDFTIQPQQAGSPARVDWRPKTSFFKVDAKVNTVSAGQPLTVDIFSPQDHQIVIRGQVPEDSAPVIRTFQVPDPASFARALFIEALRNQGIQVPASVLSVNPVNLLPEAKSYPGFSKVAELVSLPFKEYARLIIKGKALAGYLTDIKGRPLAFAVFVNMVPGPELTDTDATTGFIMTVGQDLAKIAEAIYLGDS